VKEHVDDRGFISWEAAPEALPGRTARSAQRRWQTLLAANRVVPERMPARHWWSDREEDRLLRLLRKKRKKGWSWMKVIQCFDSPNRTETAIMRKGTKLQYARKRPKRRNVQEEEEEHETIDREKGKEKDNEKENGEKSADESENHEDGEELLEQVMDMIAEKRRAEAKRTRAAAGQWVKKKQGRSERNGEDTKHTEQLERRVSSKRKREDDEGTSRSGRRREENVPKGLAGRDKRYAEALSRWIFWKREDRAAPVSSHRILREEEDDDKFLMSRSKKRRRTR